MKTRMAHEDRIEAQNNYWSLHMTSTIHTLVRVLIVIVGASNSSLRPPHQNWTNPSTAVSTNWLLLYISTISSINMYYLHFLYNVYLYLLFNIYFYCKHDNILL